jgi:hypothetical protein
LYLAFGRSNKEAVAPTPEMTGGPAGDRVFLETDWRNRCGFIIRINVYKNTIR